MAQSSSTSTRTLLQRKRKATSSCGDEPPLKKNLYHICNKPRTIEISKEDWKFGYNADGKAKTRIIVTIKDDQNGKWVQHYDKKSKTKKYYCLGCLNNKRIMNHAEFINDIFNTPIFHDCKKICAKLNAKEQFKKEKEFMKYPWNYSPPLYTFSKPRYQEFSFPNLIILYLIKNPRSHGIYNKLVKSCKWFYYRNHLALVERIHMNGDVEVHKVIEWDIDHSIKFIAYSNDPAPITPLFTFNKPRHQEFTFPVPLIRYLILNPQTPATYDKLIKTCKWFFHRNILNFVQKSRNIQIDDDVALIEPYIEWNV